ncbi:MAG TPA: bifunctional ADP-heptose synthase [Chitinophagaceae bacterium]|nr:bifunctional ADP-heptose synthase [Chitinophagaceae bacterium]
MQDFETLFNTIAGLKVAVIGDVMLDTYWWGRVDRISPEAPVPVVSLQTKEYRLGGAGNVALNTIALHAPTYLFSVIGNDDDGQILLNILQQQGINTGGIIKSGQRITTNKTRIISRNQQMMRLDAEITTDIAASEEAELITAFATFVNNTKPDIVIFEDYNKGVLTPGLIQAVIALCRQHGIITAVDPKRNNFFAYNSVDIFKPNLKEVKEGLNLPLPDITLSSLMEVNELLHQKLQHSISLITLSEKGVFVQQGQHARIIPAHLRNITDVSGAGDTVIAVASLVYAATRDIALSASMANLAGGLVCEEVGTVAINAASLLQECRIVQLM